MKLHLLLISLILPFLFGTSASTDDAQDRVQEFYAAVCKGDLNAVKQYVSEGVSVDRSVHYYETPLMCAARNGYVEVFNYLLSKGANVREIDADGKNVLMWAAEADRMEIVETLLANKVGVDPQDKQGNTALSWACAWKEDHLRDVAEEKHADIVVRLLSAGSEINHRNRQGRTPLMLAARCNSATCVRALLNKQTEVEQLDKDGNTALLLACNYGYADVVELLVSHHANVNVANRKGETPLMLAAENGDVRSVRLLLSKGADVKREDKSGRTVRDYALVVNVGALLRSAGVHFPPSEGKPDAEAASRLDYALYDLILADMRRVPQFDPWRRSQEKGGSGPRVDTRTATPSACFESKVNGRAVKQDVLELMKYDVERGGRSPYKARTDILEDVLRRNVKTASLSDYQPRFEARPFRPNGPRNDRGVLDCLLSFALPGYSVDGNTAYVFFRYADGGMHGGGRGIYCLQKQEGAWQVAWQSIVIYV